jgi:hypothetical protein
MEPPREYRTRTPGNTRSLSDNRVPGPRAISSSVRKRPTPSRLRSSNPTIFAETRRPSTSTEGKTAATGIRRTTTTTESGPAASTTTDSGTNPGFRTINTWRPEGTPDSLNLPAESDTVRPYANSIDAAETTSAESSQTRPEMIVADCASRRDARKNVRNRNRQCQPGENHGLRKRGLRAKLMSIALG